MNTIGKYLTKMLKVGDNYTDRYRDFISDVMKISERYLKEDDIEYFENRFPHTKNCCLERDECYTDVKKNRLLKKNLVAEENFCHQYEFW
jgi:hypothetical protein